MAFASRLIGCDGDFWQDWGDRICTIPVLFVANKSHCGARFVGVISSSTSSSIRRRRHHHHHPHHNRHSAADRRYACIHLPTRGGGAVSGDWLHGCPPELRLQRSLHYRTGLSSSPIRPKLIFLADRILAVMRFAFHFRAILDASSASKESFQNAQSLARSLALFSSFPMTAPKTIYVGDRGSAAAPSLPPSLPPSAAAGNL